VERLMKSEMVRYDIDVEQIARVSLSRAEKHNALNPEMMQALIDIFEAISGNTSIRAVVLSGEGESFCAGGDLEWMRSNLSKPRAERIAESRILGQMFEVIDQCPKLVIARVNGAAYGGGLGLISVCDIAIGVNSAQFALSEVKLGLVPANIAPYVLKRMGASNLRRVALNARRFDGVQACKLGLLDLVVDEGVLDEAVGLELNLALASAPGAMTRTKQLLAELSSKKPISNDYLVEVLADTWDGEEAQAGIRAFFDKLPPPWER
jgi:methylglutaconyl-CoA hydratase